MNYMQAVAEEIRGELPGTLLLRTASEPLLLLYALLATTAGTGVTARQVHDAWTVWKTLTGEEHASMVPFEQLSAETRDEDLPFVQVIRRVAERLG